jgi:hypothetical protein
MICRNSSLKGVPTVVAIQYIEIKSISLNGHPKVRELGSLTGVV